MTRTVDGVAVVIPARDEESTIQACLHGVHAALDRLPPDIAVGVTVVLDRCTDRTAERAALGTSGRPGSVAVTTGARIGTGVGAVRVAGVDDALARLALPPERVRLLHTDADSVVPPDWAQAHLRHAEDGAVAVAGTVDLEEPGADLHALCVPWCGGSRHGHVYGANLGVRADAYRAVGGFPSDGPGEDVRLWQALRVAGLRTASPTAIRVRTSGRLHGRATGGLADLLRTGQGVPLAGM